MVEKTSKVPVIPGLDSHAQYTPGPREKKIERGPLTKGEQERLRQELNRRDSGRDGSIDSQT